MRVKRLLYFVVASYFRFFASIQLTRWHPTVVVITGSSGKTTLLHLIESQLGSLARYSHHANSAFGIPFDILGLHRVTLKRSEWTSLFLRAPLSLFKKNPHERIYIVEADCDRPHEGKFVASLLKPHITLWMNSGRTHTMNFDRLVKNGTYTTIESAVAHEFGYFIEFTQQLVIVNGDSPVIEHELQRTRAQIQKVSLTNLEKYSVHAHATEFTYNKQVIHVPFLMPQETFYALGMTTHLLSYLHKDATLSFSSFQLPPGRSTLFTGIHDTIIVDSSYNATPDGMEAILHMFSMHPGKQKWAVIGDMLELGNEEAIEHQKLASLLIDMNLDQIILVGPRTQKHTYPLLKDAKARVVSYDKPADALHYLEKNIQGKEVILFKGARFLEGIIEHVLENKSDIDKLCRRELAWQKRREQWGL